MELRVWAPKAASLDLVAGEQLHLMEQQDPQTLSCAKLDWHEVEDFPHAKMQDRYQERLSYRKTHSQLLSAPASAVEVDEDAQTLVIARGEFKLAANFSGSSFEAPFRGCNIRSHRFSFGRRGRGQHFIISAKHRLLHRTIGMELRA